jgi:hypothetical protein
MNYQDVNRVINQMGMDNEPAFYDVGIAIRPFTKNEPGVLGLYYPGAETIVVPPEGKDSVLQHELGHRHGHFHYNDLTEQYAEKFRAEKSYVGQTAPDNGPKIAAAIVGLLALGMIVTRRR